MVEVNVLVAAVVEPLSFGTQASFSASDSDSTKLNRLVRYVNPPMPKEFDVFSYVSKYVCLSSFFFKVGLLRDMPRGGPRCRRKNVEPEWLKIIQSSEFNPGPRLLSVC